MAAELLLNPGYEKNGFFLLRGPMLTAAPDTVLTTANMNRSLKQLKAANALVQYAEIGARDALRIMVFGQGTTNLTATVTMYGWKDFWSPTSLIGSLTATLGDTPSEDNANATPGWHTDPEVDAKLRGAMAANEDWYPCDTYTIVTNPGTSIVTPTFTAEHPGWFEVSMALTQYQFMALMFTNTGTPMTKAVAAYSPLRGKAG
ncbi:MAG TPA: hypothetical protein VJL29_14555, partial [Thermoguttaceae bacterium]|nr:hypothetical protein [Thermoguttaceae bacterium]